MARKQLVLTHGWGLFTKRRCFRQTDFQRPISHANIRRIRSECEIVSPQYQRFNTTSAGIITVISYNRKAWYNQTCLLKTYLETAVWSWLCHPLTKSLAKSPNQTVRASPPQSRTPKRPSIDSPQVDSAAEHSFRWSGGGESTEADCQECPVKGDIIYGSFSPCNDGRRWGS